MARKPPTLDPDSVPVPSERAFFRDFRQHIDVRGRSSGKSLENRDGILREGFISNGLNVIHPYEGGEPTHIIEVMYMPKAGDVVYLVPKEGWVRRPSGGAKIRTGWVPKPWQAVVLSEDGPNMYQVYLQAIELEKRVQAEIGDDESPPPDRPRGG